MPAAKPRRGIPRVAALAVALLAIVAAVLLVGVAWRQNRAVRTEERAQAAFTDGAVTAMSGDVFVGCTDCHQDLDRVFKAGGAPLLVYRHERHFAKGVSDCSVCHPANTHEPDRINKPTMARCFICHGTTKQAIAPGGCTLCHTPGIPAKPSSHDVSAWASKAHAPIAEEDSFQCFACHEQSFCASCHGLEMPHPRGWNEETHVTAFFDQAQVCTRCHVETGQRQDFCDTCHHPQGKADEAWRDVHPKVVRDDGAGTCFECHNPTTCSTCHVRGKETFEADRNWEPSPTPVEG